MKSFRLFIPILFMLSSCAEFASPRSFVSEMDRESEGFWVAGRDFPVVAGDSGSAYRSRNEIQLRTPLNDKQRERIRSKEIVMRQLDERVETLSEEDRNNYEKDTQFLPTPSERLYYLSLAPNERAEYLKTKKPLATRTVASVSDESPPWRNTSSFAGEVVIGMSKDEVKRLWGKPVRVDVAGDPRHQNERWVFYEGGRMKQLYFESGRVEGWSLE